VEAHLECLGRRRLDADFSLDVLAHRGAARLNVTQVFLGLPERDHQRLSVVAVDEVVEAAEARELARRWKLPARDVCQFIERLGRLVERLDSSEHIVLSTVVRQ
jgi:hypothetical protein